MRTMWCRASYRCYGVCAARGVRRPYPDVATAASGRRPHEEVKVHVSMHVCRSIRYHFGSLLENSYNSPSPSVKPAVMRGVRAARGGGGLSTRRSASRVSTRAERGVATVPRDPRRMSDCRVSTITGRRPIATVGTASRGSNVGCKLSRTRSAVHHMPCTRFGLSEERFLTSLNGASGLHNVPWPCPSATHGPTSALHPGRTRRNTWPVLKCLDVLMCPRRRRCSDASTCSCAQDGGGSHGGNARP